MALPSSGLHTNGYSLARKIAFDVLGLHVDSYVAELGATVGAALLRTHRSYLPRRRARCSTRLHQGHGAHHRRRAHRKRAADVARGTRVFTRSAELGGAAAFRVASAQAGGLDDGEMFRAFNMGVGLVIVAGPDAVDAILGELHDAWVIGRVTA